MSLAFAVPSFALWREELWDTILDLSVLLPDGSWVLVGGHAVTAHALARDVDDQRIVEDGEPMGRIVVMPSALPTVTREFRHLGFTVEDTRSGTELRYVRAADGHDADQRSQTWQVHVIGATSVVGGEQAFARRVPYQATKGLRAPLVPVPDLLATVIFEAAQFATDTATPFVRARDAAFLVSLLADPAAEHRRLTAADRRALRVMNAAVGDPGHHVWTRLPSHRDAFTRWRLLLAV